MSAYKGFDMDLSLKGKVAVITGGTSGIGYETAKLFEKKGAKVVIIGSRENTEELAKDISSDVLGYVVDLRDYKKVDEVMNEIAEKTGGIDILCNLAGIGSGIAAEDITMEEFDNVLKVNLSGVFNACKAVGNIMIKQGRGGKIVNAASDAGLKAVFGHVAYSASKAGLLAVTRALAFEWGKYGINVNAVSPTVVMTPMSRAFWSGERAEKRIANIPVGRFGEMDEVAMAFVYLASDAASMISGENLVIDGGLTSHS